MKHQVPESMKFRKLQRRLGTSRLVTVGTLELLWISTQKNAPQGDIGRYSNEEIAIECEWEGDPDELVEALTETGWLDACSDNRLVVHDWQEHAPGWIKRQLGRHRKSFVTASSLLTVTDDQQEATRNLTQPNLTQPKETQPKDKGASAPCRLGPELEPDGPAVVEDAERFVRVWNATEGVRACRRLSDSRRRSLRARAEETIPTESGEVGWLDALELAAADKFPLRMTVGRDGWLPDADWILRPDSLAKIFEGKYDFEAHDANHPPRIGAGQRYDGPEHASYDPHEAATADGF